MVALHLSSLRFALVYGSNLMVHRLLSSADDDTLFLVREVMDFLISCSPVGSWGASRTEP